MSIMKWIRSLLGCGCQCGSTQTVLVPAQTIRPDQPLVADLPGAIRSLGNDFIYEVVPALGLQIQESSGRVKLAQAHLSEKNRATTVEALGALVEGNEGRIPSGYRLALDSGDATLEELQLGEKGGVSVRCRSSSCIQLFGRLIRRLIRAFPGGGGVPVRIAQSNRHVLRSGDAHTGVLLRHLGRNWEEQEEGLDGMRGLVRSMGRLPVPWRSPTRQCLPWMAEV
jgi:hypothetical protein